MDTLLLLINANRKHCSCFYFDITIFVTVLFFRRATGSFRLYMLLGFALFSKILFSRLKILTLALSYLQPRTYYCLKVPKRVTRFYYDCFIIKIGTGTNTYNFTA